MNRILAVDDDLVYLQRIRDYLHDPSIELVTAGDAAEAARVLSQRSIDLILLDYMLPGLSGMDFLKQIKSDQCYAHIPVVFQSAAAHAAGLREARAAGAAYSLQKGVEPAVLMAIVHSLLREVAAREGSTEKWQLLGFMRALAEARFEFRTLGEAQRLADGLGVLCPNPERAALGLAELFVNAIEHGNLEISYEEKARLCRLDGWSAEVERRLQMPAFRARRVRVDVERDPRHVRFVVRDDGPGFRWREFLELDSARIFAPNGRGIALARALSFSKLTYLEPGNVVIADVSLEQGHVAA